LLSNVIEKSRERIAIKEINKIKNKDAREYFREVKNMIIINKKSAEKKIMLIAFPVFKGSIELKISSWFLYLRNNRRKNAMKLSKIMKKIINFPDLMMMNFIL
jgi:hypothetical protein